MIRAMLWKEYREHRAIWLTLAFVGGAGLFGLSQLMAPGGLLSTSSARESLQSVAILFAWTYGLVCGAMLLASEHESGTLTFLDILPARRLQLWLVKCLFGLLLLVTQIAVLAGLVVGLGVTETMGQFSATLLVMSISGLIALSWSLLFSAVGDNVLNVIGLSFVGQIAGGFVVLFLAFSAGIGLKMIWGGQPNFYDAFQIFVACLGFLAMIAGPILGSAHLFTRLDRQRARAAKKLPRPLAEMSEWSSWGRLIWLSYAQLRRLLVILTFSSLILGLLLLALGPAAWPLLTLLLGILCGVTVWSDEQMSAAFRFLGDQRFPLGRVWIVKVGMRFALAAFAAFLLLLPSLIRAGVHQAEAHAHGGRVMLVAPNYVPFAADLFHSNLVGPVVPIRTHLLIWLLYGFSAGHLCGLLFRKSLVAAVVALGTSGMLLCLWVPSLVGIGLHFWQVAGVPLILLVAGWLLMPAWAADRLLARGTFVRLGSALLAAVLWTAGGLWYRIAEIPDLPDGLNMPAFVASVPSMDQSKNAAGMEMHAAWHEVETMTQDLYSNSPRVGRQVFRNQLKANTFKTFQGEILKVLSHGWPILPSDLGDRLDDWFRKDWYKHLRTAAQSPLGVVEDAKQRRIDAPISTRWDLLPQLNQVLAVRALQMQAHGDHAVFVDHLRIGLALARNVQNHAPGPLVQYGRRAELECTNALDRWLEKLPGHPDLLERVRDILLQHEAELPDESDVVKTSCLLAQNTLELNPEILVEGEIAARKQNVHATFDMQEAEMDLIRLLWQVPWEIERHQRILRLVFVNDEEQRKRAQRWGGAYLRSIGEEAHKLKPRERTTASLRAALLKVGLRLYQAKNGKLPDRLDALVPFDEAQMKHLNYLPDIPLDPFDLQPFRYRLQLGEDGQPPKAVLWSVGEDKQDDGGKVQGFNHPQTFPGEDLRFDVPPPPR